MRTRLSLKCTLSQILLGVFILIISTKTYSATDYYFRQLSLQDGLSQSTIRCIYNDQKGFVWIGTKSGLNRYDQQAMKMYFRDPNDETSLPGNRIHFITEDPQENLWVGTSQGLARYNRNHDNFETVLQDDRPMIIRCALEEKESMLFAGNGLWRYDYKTQKFKTIYLKSQTDHFTESIYYISPLDENHLILGSRWFGLWVYNKQTHLVERFKPCLDDKISAFFRDDAGNFWISAYSRGLSKFSPKGELLRSYTTSNSKLSNDIILDIDQRNGDIWIATDGGGVCILDPISEKFDVIAHISGDRSSIPVNSISCLYLDKTNNMWAGTIRAGLLGIREVSMKTYEDAPYGHIHGLSEKTVLTLYEDSDASLWIGTDGGGLNKMDQRSNTFTHFPSGYNSKVVSITEINTEYLLISVFGKGLFRFHKKSGRAIPLYIVNKKRNEEINQMGITVQVNKISPSQILILADSAYVYDIPSDRFLPAVYTIAPNEPPIHRGALRVVHTSVYNTYLSNSQGIFEINNYTRELKTIYRAKGSSYINNVCFDNKGNFWIGSTTGLERFDPFTKESYEIKTNLFHTVSALRYDKSGRLWIGAENMLFCYKTIQNKFSIVGESDGATPNEYLPYSSCLSVNGDIYLGGVTGLLRIKQNVSFEMTSSPVVSLMDIEADGISITDRITKQKEISLPWSHSTLAIKVVAKEKDIFRKQMFRFFVEELDGLYVESYDHTLALHSLPPGDYSIKASCSTRDGGWSPFVSLMKVSVSTPWWKTTWFMILTTFCIVVLFVILSMYVIRHKEIKLNEELQEQEKKSNEDKVRFFINISHELRTPLTLIYAPMKRLLQQDTLDDDVKLRITSIYKQVKQMKSIIDMVLDIRRMEAGFDRVNAQLYDLNAWLHEIAEDFQMEAESKNIQLAFDLHADMDQVAFDQAKCQMVLNNILMNAIKFSPASTQITISTTLYNDKVRVAVSDQGIGLDHVDISKLFTRFYQGDHQHKGTGIGLSMSKMLMEMQHGSIGAFPNADLGATFYIELPLATQEDIPRSTTETQDSTEVAVSLPKADALSPHSILLVEDESDLLSFLQESLQEYYSTIYIAKDGCDALEIIKRHMPDIVVSDVMMPRMDGFELCRSIKEDLEISHIPVILLTARADAQSATLGYKMGADAYLAKPFELDLLRSVVDSQLRSRSHIKQRYSRSTIQITPEEATFSNVDEKLLLQINTLILDNLDNAELDVKFLVTQIGASRASLYSKMKALTGMGVNDYINKFRIEKASILLQQTDMSIQEIADRTGFSSQRYFSTVFKQATGYTPTKYKDQNRTNSSS